MQQMVKSDWQTRPACFIRTAVWDYNAVKRKFVKIAQLNMLRSIQEILYVTHIYDKQLIYVMVIFI